MVKLKLFASLREIAGSKEIEIDGDELSVKQALEKLAERCGQKARDILFDQQGQVWPSVLLLVNGEATESGPETRVKSGDEVSVLLPTAGG